ncbi:hypothetical protein ACEPAH_7017 [Sanghuangporus vaninii]
MQQPTCSNIRIRSTRDAHIIFHAVSLNILPIISRRLDADERAALRSGCVYAWEERGPHTEVTGLGIERFTEGRRWGPSRVRDEFLFYYEKSPPGHLRDKENPLLDERVRKHWDPLVKQTYSVWVDGPRGRRKWHLTAYFTQATVDRLQTVDDLPQLRGLEVPPGKYISTRQGKPRRQDDHIAAGSIANGADLLTPGISRSTSVSASRTYAPFPLPYQVTPPAMPSISQQHLYDPRLQYYGQPPLSVNGYNPPEQPSRSMNVDPDARRHHYGPPADIPRPAEQARVQPHGYYSGPPSFQHHYPAFQYSYGPSGTNSHINLQLPTPTATSCQSSPGYSPHDYTGESTAYSGSPSLLYGSPAAGGSEPLPSQVYHSLLPIPVDRLKRPPPINIPSLTRPELPSPESLSPGEMRPTLSLPPHLASRLSPPMSDARDERPQGNSVSLSPPQSPHSAVSSSSVPGGKQLSLAPLRSLARPHPYRRDKFDDKALMALSGRRAPD